MATYIGSANAGILGSAVATFAVVLPSFIIIVLIAAVLKNIIKNKYVVRALEGIKAVVLGLITATGITLMLTCLGYKDLNNFNFNYNSLICLIILALIYFIFLKLKKKKINTIILILTSAILGIIVCLITNI